MKKKTIDEQIEEASRKVEEWPQWVKDATEFKVSERYYNEQSWSEDGSAKKGEKPTTNKLSLVRC